MTPQRLHPTHLGCAQWPVSYSCALLYCATGFLKLLRLTLGSQHLKACEHLKEGGMLVISKGELHISYLFWDQDSR